MNLFQDINHSISRQNSAASKALVIISLAQEHRRTRRDRKVKLLQVKRD
jgi:hypothetical protein